MVGSWQADDDQIMSLITAISWPVVYPGMLHIDSDARAKQLREAHGRGWRDCRGRQAEEDWARRARKFEIARHASHFLGLERQPAAELPPAALPTLSYAAANRRSRRATYLTVCSKRVTLLGNGKGQ
jgi:hypothetical protein